MATVTVDDHMRGGVPGFFQSANSLAIILSTGAGVAGAGEEGGVEERESGGAGVSWAPSIK